MIGAHNHEHDYEFYISYDNETYTGYVFFDKDKYFYSTWGYSEDSQEEYNPKSGKIWLFDEERNQTHSYDIEDRIVDISISDNIKHQIYYEELQSKITKFLKLRCFS